MPNWCENRLEISSDTDHMKEFIEWLDDGKDVLSRILPIPGDLPYSGCDDESQKQAMQEKYGFTSGYDFCVARWGTKWDIDLDVPPSGDSDASIPTVYHTYFESAWAPPVAGITALAARFPHLSIELKYNEPGVFFSGTAAWENGVLVEDDVKDYAMDVCECCGDDKRADSMTSYDSPVVTSCCADCLPFQSELYGPAEVLVCCDDPQVLSVLFNDLSRHTVLTDVLGMSATEVIECTFGEMYKRAQGISFTPTDFLDAARTAESPASALPVAVSHTDGGSLLVSYTAPKGAQETLWDELSRRYPQVTFYVTGGGFDDDAGTTTVLAAGETFSRLS